MSELILTDEEKAAPYWNDFDDAALGKAVKAMWFKWFSEDSRVDGLMDLAHKTATVGMCCRIHAMNAAHFECKLQGVHDGGFPCGDWKITFERTNVPDKK